jgi:peptidyl-prolyl cis-trans isomerase SurA
MLKRVRPDAAAWRRLICTGLMLLAAAVPLLRAAGEELIDEPIAVVADRVILRSEWEAQVTMLALQTKRDVNDPVVRDSLAPELLEQMINDELILIQAERDTTLEVTQEEVEKALTDHIEGLRNQFASEEEFQSELAREGLTERDLRVRYRRDVRNQLLKQKLIQRKLRDVSVSNGEVREFFANYKDSLPDQPAGIKLAHILLPVEASEETIDSARSAITRILEKIRNGLDFGEAARQYSQDVTAESGGDLGWFGSGDMVPTFENAAFSLVPGQVSGVVRTRYGFHLIQCVERKDDRVHARHILVSASPSAQDSARVYALADSIATVAREGGDFCQLAQTFSQDAESQKNCGELGWYPIEEMFPEFRAALEGAVPGDIVGPVSTDFGWHILRVLDQRERRSFNLTDDWDAIKEMARREKTNRVVSEWIEGIRAETYVNVRTMTQSERITP